MWKREPWEACEGDEGVGRIKFAFEWSNSAMAGRGSSLGFPWKGVWMIPDDLPSSLFPGAVPAAAGEFKICFWKVVAGNTSHFGINGGNTTIYI